MRERMDHAVVIGASMAGLLAARVLSERFDRVTVLDRDRMPQVAEHRRGVPQGRHAHALLARGREILDELFPGLTGELLQHGGLIGDLQGTTTWVNDGHRVRQVTSGLEGIAISRPLLEGVVRRRTAELHNVAVVERCDASGLMADERGARVTGVRVRDRDSGDVRYLSADLVVDAAGRGSQSPAWLAALGYPEPSRDEVRVDITYTTRMYRRAPEHVENHFAVVIAATPATPRFGVLVPLEGDRWIVSMGGYGNDPAPMDNHGYLAFAASLTVPDIHEVIREAEPLGEPAQTRYPASVRWRYERLRRFPDGYLVCGDAICGFNPIYGQGMTVAACEALVLRDCLRRGTDRLAPRFFRRVATALDNPWDIAVGGDLRMPQVDGERSARMRVINAYLARLHRAAASDPAVGLAFIRVANLLDHPARLLSPAVALRVARANVRRPPATPGHTPTTSHETTPVEVTL